MSVSYYGGSVRVARVDWTSDAAGAATQVVHVDGQILRVVTDPAAAGAAPTDDYDITFVDEDGFDIMGGGLANRDTANTESYSTNQPNHFGNVTVTVANAGDTKSGSIKIYMR